MCERVLLIESKIDGRMEQVSTTRRWVEIAGTWSRGCSDTRRLDGAIWSESRAILLRFTLVNFTFLFTFGK